MVDVTRIEEDIEEVKDTQQKQGSVLARLVYWRDGNGARGAEKRIQDLEDTTDVLDREAVRASTCEKYRNELESRITKAVEDAIKKAARRPLVRDWGPVLIGLLAAASPVIVSLISKGGTK